VKDDAEDGSHIMNERLGLLIIGLRLAAVVVMIAAVSLMWRVMASLPWGVDCLIATGAAFAFAYRFEREESR
jgi:hypothetical protein